MNEASTQKHMLPLLQKYLQRNGPASQRDLETEMYRRLSGKKYFCGGGYFYQRLQTLVRRGQLVKLKQRGSKCLYALPDGFPTEFDLTDPTARLVASDKAEENGQLDVAELLRSAKTIAFGKKVKK